MNTNEIVTALIDQIKKYESDSKIDEAKFFVNLISNELLLKILKRDESDILKKIPITINKYLTIKFMADSNSEVILKNVSYETKEISEKYNDEYNRIIIENSSKNEKDKIQYPKIGNFEIAIGKILSIEKKKEITNIYDNIIKPPLMPLTLTSSSTLPTKPQTSSSTLPSFSTPTTPTPTTPTTPTPTPTTPSSLSSTTTTTPPTLTSTSTSASSTPTATVFDEIIATISNKELQKIMIEQKKYKAAEIDAFNNDQSKHTPEKIKEFIKELFISYDHHSKLTNDEFKISTKQFKDKFNEVAVSSSPTERTLLNTLNLKPQYISAILDTLIVYIDDDSIKDKIKKIYKGYEIDFIKFEDDKVTDRIKPYYSTNLEVVKKLESDCFSAYYIPPSETTRTPNPTTPPNPTTKPSEEPITPPIYVNPFITNITSEPTVYPKPTTVSIESPKEKIYSENVKFIKNELNNISYLNSNDISHDIIHMNGNDIIDTYIEYINARKLALPLKKQSETNNKFIKLTQKINSDSKSFVKKEPSKLNKLKVLSEKISKNTLTSVSAVGIIVNKSPQINNVFRNTWGQFKPSFETHQRYSEYLKMGISGQDAYALLRTIWTLNQMQYSTSLVPLFDQFVSEQEISLMTNKMKQMDVGSIAHSIMELYFP